jgi:hypothetical protein
LRLVPYSDCSHPNCDRRIVYELKGTTDASEWWVTEHQDPTFWAPAAHGSPEGQSTGNENDGPGGFDDIIKGWNRGRSTQSFTVSREDPRKSPGTQSFPVTVQLPSGPEGEMQDYGSLGIYREQGHGYVLINGKRRWVGCINSFEADGYRR